MARITRVERAQARYPTRPVIDPATGEPKRTPVMRKDGTQKTTKSGRPVFMAVTERVPGAEALPLRTCDARPCLAETPEIKIGTPYKHISPRSGPYGGRTLYRHARCPDWHVWEYNSSLSAMMALMQYNFSEAVSSAESEDDVRDALTAAAEEVREAAGGRRESAENIESGFGHETSTSQQLADEAEQLDSWADEIEQAEVPTLEEITDEEVSDGKEKDESSEEARERLTAGRLEEWRDSLWDELGVVEEVPV